MLINWSNIKTRSDWRNMSKWLHKETLTRLVDCQLSREINKYKDCLRRCTITSQISQQSSALTINQVEEKRCFQNLLKNKIHCCLMLKTESDEIFYFFFFIFRNIPLQYWSHEMINQWSVFVIVMWPAIKMLCLFIKKGWTNKHHCTDDRYFVLCLIFLSRNIKIQLLSLNLFFQCAM